MTAPTPFDGKVGDRSGRLDALALQGGLNATPTGRNLLVGSDVEYLFDSDPTGTVGSWPDGARGIAVSGSDLLVLRYTRETGWKSVTLT